MSVQVIELGRREKQVSCETILIAKTCKNCGAPMRSNKCEYCGTEYESAKVSQESGKVPDNNENWFCSLPTEEKAQWLENKMTWAAQEQGTFTAKGWEMWLKQPHHEKE